MPQWCHAEGALAWRLVVGCVRGTVRQDDSPTKLTPNTNNKARKLPSAVVR